MNKKLTTIGEAAKMLGTSIDTLRRWDKNGVLKSFRPTPTSKRLYRITDINKFINQSEEEGKKNLSKLAKAWAQSELPIELQKKYYCQTKDVFEARYHRLINELPTELANILVAITSEIGNNSYDHNIGKWEDAPGIFFAHDEKNKQIIIADRGQGILKTLKRVKPTLKNSSDALHTAFTEVISGRAPEARGNGLKFVKRTIENYPLSIHFQTGDAIISIEKERKDLQIQKTKPSIIGCIATINY